MNGLFVTGTDTEVGKTYFVCKYAREQIQRGYRIGVYKPAASGYPREDHRSDAAQLHRSLGEQGAKVRLERINPQCFLAPLAPPLAARAEGLLIDQELLVRGADAWKEECDCLIVEGAGGLFSPITWSMTNADLAKKFGFPLILVAENRLGCVHQILSTIRAAISMELEVQAVVLNQLRYSGDASQMHNRELLAPFLGELGPQIELWELPYRSDPESV